MVSPGSVLCQRPLGGKFGPNSRCDEGDFVWENRPATAPAAIIFLIAKIHSCHLLTRLCHIQMFWTQPRECSYVFPTGWLKMPPQQVSLCTLSCTLGDFRGTWYIRVCSQQDWSVEVFSWGPVTIQTSFLSVSEIQPHSEFHLNILQWNKLLCCDLTRIALACGYKFWQQMELY